MKFSYFKIVIFILLPFFLGSCDKQEHDYLQPTAYEDVDHRLWGYFEKFEQEAASRGIVIDLRVLSVAGRIEKIGADRVAGLCEHSPVNGRRVIIDAGFWDRASDSSKEAMIFHELGHCVLGRGHVDGVLDNGMCKSLMRSGFNQCITMYKGDDNQKLYLDELFFEE